MTFSISAATIEWDVESKCGVTKASAKPGTDKAIAAARTFFRTNPNDTLVLNYGSGVYHFQGREDQIDFGTGFGPGTSGRLIVRGKGHESTEFMTDSPEANTITGADIFRVTFEGIHFSRNYVTFSQGTIVSMTANSVTIDLHDGFPEPNVLWVIPGKDLQLGKYLRKYTDDIDDPQLSTERNLQVPWDPNRTKRSLEKERRWVFGIIGDFRKNDWKPGDVLAIKCKHGGQAYEMNGGGDIAFADCKWTAHSRGVLRGRISNIRFSRCRVDRQGRVGGRVPCLSTSEGGPQIGQPRDPPITGVLVEDCVFTASGDDNVALFNVKSGIIRNCYSRDAFARGILLYNSPAVELYCNQVIRSPIEGDFVDKLCTVATRPTIQPKTLPAGLKIEGNRLIVANSSGGQVKIWLLNLQGSLIGTMTAAEPVVWDLGPSGIRPGVYLVKARIAQETHLQRMVVR